MKLIITRVINFTDIHSFLNSLSVTEIEIMSGWLSFRLPFCELHQYFSTNLMAVQVISVIYSSLRCHYILNFPARVWARPGSNTDLALSLRLKDVLLI